jgi:hypothetical protein
MGYVLYESAHSWEEVMHDPQELRNLARKCRQWRRAAMEPDVIDQLRLWAVELADCADAVDRCDVASTGNDRRLNNVVSSDQLEEGAG